MQKPRSSGVFVNNRNKILSYFVIREKIAVLTSGGDAPGMNACIRSVIRACAHYNLRVYGIHRGYQGLIENEIHPMTASSVANIIQMGGTILKTARSMDFMTPEGRKKAHKNLVKSGIEGIICIGGNGTYTGAMIFEKEFGIPSMGCPGTIDNDLWGTDATIGYDTAINTAMEAIDKIRDTADAHNRIFLLKSWVDIQATSHYCLVSLGAQKVFSYPNAEMNLMI